MKAVIIKEAGKAEVTDIKEQSMRPDYIKIKSVALGVNPSTVFDGLTTREPDNRRATADFHHTAFAGLVGGILGRNLHQHFMATAGPAPHRL